MQVLFNRNVLMVGASLMLAVYALPARSQELAKTGSAARLELGEHFERVGAPQVYRQESGGGYSKYGGSVHCYDKSLEIRIYWGFINYYPHPRFSLAPEKPYARNTRYWYGAREGCEWDQRQVELGYDRYLSPFLNLKQSLVLDRLANSGTTIRGRLILEGPGLSSVLALNGTRLEAIMKLELDECRNQDGETQTTRLAEGSTTDLRSIIGRLRARGYRQFMKCNFKVEGLTLGAQILKSGSIHFMEGYVTVLDGHEDHLLASRAANPTQGTDLFGEYSRVGERRDPLREQTAIAAAREFVDFITGEYGDLLYRLAENEARDGERREAVRAFFDRHGEQIRGWFAAMDENYAHVSLMNKISMLVSLNDMYRTIQEIEKTVVKTSTMNLDRIVKEAGRAGR